MHDTIDAQSQSELFFDFDQSHHSRFDLVAMIDFIKLKNGSEKLAYVGHSLGTTIMFRLAAE